MKTNREEFQKLFPLTLKGMEKSIQTELPSEFDLYADERHADGSLAIFSVGKENISCFFASNFDESEIVVLNSVLANNELDWIKNNIQRRENGNSFLIIPEVTMKYHFPSLLTVALGRTILDGLECDSWTGFKVNIDEEDKTGNISSIRIYGALNPEATLFQRDVLPLDYLLNEARWFIETTPNGDPVSFLMESFDLEEDQLLKTLFSK